MRHPPNPDPENWHPPQEEAMHNKGDVFAALQTDLRARDEKGWTEHGVMLDWRFNRNWLREAYEEALDLAVYLKAELMRQEEQDAGKSRGGCCR